VTPLWRARVRRARDRRARVPAGLWPAGLCPTLPFNGPLSGTPRVSQYHKGKTDLDFTEARDNEWQWHPLGHMQVCTSLQSDNHASTPPLSFLQAGCSSCRPTNSIKALKAEECQCTQNSTVLRHFTTMYQSVL